MQTQSKTFAVGLAFGLIAMHAKAAITSQADFFRTAITCAPTVDRTTLAAIANVESGFNPYAIGVVGGRLERQPVSLGEAIATVNNLQKLGYNFSMGLIQVNRYNVARLGENYQSIFDPCRNLRAGAQILVDCFNRARSNGMNQQAALRAAFSCYYSGNFATGFNTGYVQRVVASAGVDTPQSGSEVIPVIKAGRARDQQRPSVSQQEPSAPWVFITNDSGTAPADVAQHRVQLVPSGQEPDTTAQPSTGVIDTTNPRRANQSPVNVEVVPQRPTPSTTLPRTVNGPQSNDSPFVEIVK